MVCILSPEITLDDIQYPEMREVLNNITNLQWPRKQETREMPKSVAIKEYVHFWNRLFFSVLKGNQKYPKLSLIRSSQNVPVWFSIGLVQCLDCCANRKHGRFLLRSRGNQARPKIFGIFPFVEQNKGNSPVCKDKTKIRNGKMALVFRLPTKVSMNNVSSKAEVQVKFFRFTHEWDTGDQCHRPQDSDKSMRPESSRWATCWTDLLMLCIYTFLILLFRNKRPNFIRNVCCQFWSFSQKKSFREISEILIGAHVWGSLIPHQRFFGKGSTWAYGLDGPLFASILWGRQKPGSADECNTTVQVGYVLSETWTIGIPRKLKKNSRRNCPISTVLNIISIRFSLQSKDFYLVLFSFGLSGRYLYGLKQKRRNIRVFIHPSMSVDPNKNIFVTYISSVPNVLTLAFFVSISAFSSVRFRCFLMYVKFVQPPVNPTVESVRVNVFCIQAQKDKCTQQKGTNAAWQVLVFKRHPDRQCALVVSKCAKKCPKEIFQFSMGFGCVLECYKQKEEVFESAIFFSSEIDKFLKRKCWVICFCW